MNTWIRRPVSPLLAGLCALSIGCLPTHGGRTIGQGNLQIEGAIVGPFVENLGAPIPIPNLPVGARYGVTDRLDVAGHVNLLPLFAGGFLMIDGGATWALVRHEGDRGPNLASATSLVLMTDFQEGARISPVVDLVGGYTIRWFTFFVGVEVMADFWRGAVHADPMVGFEFDIRRWSLNLGVRWFHPAGNSFASSFEYITSGSQGGLGVWLGLEYRRPGRGRDDDV